MTTETLYTIRKYLVRARVQGHTEEEEFFQTLQALDRAIIEQKQRHAQLVA
jgi:hypothetical protein